ncbi:probable inactive ATP-dependent zinc metalloprotease FTSHI 5, chloroplastic [Prosopis cineraria]|uniref:probable inactive ATP-dependent zinc metalloprotease FTSHI 5, chloroplastic n=1 Tax=Prosopis cineraria TaxID=364024 RepID=UPI00240F8E05|nr:probable inactive ATP-dependent zinc metalloprotease FTSHI 5, chloroplastic [Prosopis cineraria]XP_054777170.1 probable inactive ATP-dependent zinc metalloprotease FTSHI 5, chloroplastic [Prosopis cineraria]
MDATVASPMIHVSCTLKFVVQSPYGVHLQIPFDAVRRTRNRGFKSKSWKRSRNISSFASGIQAISFSSKSIRSEGGQESVLEDYTGSRSVKLEDNLAIASVNHENAEDTFFKSIFRQLLYTLFCFAIGFSSLGAVRVPAIAAPAVNEDIVGKKDKGKDKNENLKGHEYSDCTKRLLETVSSLLRSIEEVRKGDGNMDGVQLAMKAVSLKKGELENEIMSKLYAELKELKRDKGRLERRAGQIIDEVAKAKGDCDKLRQKVIEDTEKARMEKLNERMRELERDYDEVWERVSEIDELILRRETVALSFGVREISFIERECEQLVKKFKREIGKKVKISSPKRSITKLPKVDLQKDLENVQRRHLEQLILPSILAVEDLGSFFDQDSIDLAQRLRKGLKDSRELQRNLEARMRNKMKKFGRENRCIIYSPEDEVVKGFPEVELKWMFGNKEVMVPNAIGLHLYHGWKEWREEAKAKLKRSLIEDAEFARQYVAERQERILVDRDRVVSKTWYNEEKNRWEMDPMAVPYAVSKKLIDHVRIRHDWGAMYVALKGEEKEIFVDIKEYEMIFDKFGGFDGLYMKMLASGIPATVHLMWIPFSDLDIHQQFLLTLRLSHRFLSGLWNSGIVLHARNWVFKKIKNITDDILMMIVFPIVEFLVPYPVRMRLGMAWPEEIDQTVDATWYLKWQSEAELNFKSRKTDDARWFIWFFIRTSIFGFFLFHLFQFMMKKVPSLVGYGPIRRDPNVQKLRRVKSYVIQKLRRIKHNRKAGFDPIKTAFEEMKRVKKPPILLKNFASIESMREEINEVVAFLQNPRAFQEMGARAPRGVLIVGERGTGKTSLALAIAAEARVPVVEIKAQQLEAGLWVGQSASNVRELFQTARDLAPVIIFVEDFDLFAGVRGKFIHTKNQDHEAFINQLLVELDGFERQDGVVLMATTRSLKQIDEALQRPGRMDRIFHLQRPTQAEREKILYLAAKETMDDQLIDYVDWKKVAEKTALLRPIELQLVPVALEGGAFQTKVLDTEELMSYCSFFATFSSMIPEWVRMTKVARRLSKMFVSHLGLTLTKEDLQHVVELMEPYGQISNGIELLSPPLDWTRETKFPHAVWAAGRGLIALLLPNFDVVDNLWLEPLSWQGIGCTKITKARNEGSVHGNSESRSYLEKKLVFCFGSYVASQMLLPFGEENVLSSSEIQQAQEIATRMVIQYGWGPDDNPAIYYHSNAVTSLSMGDDHEYVMANKVEKMFDLAYQKAKEMLQKNRSVLEKIVEELLEFEILTEKDLGRIVEDNGGLKEKEPFSLCELYDEQPTSGSLLEGGSASGSSALTVA